MTRRDLFNPNIARDAARDRAAALKARVTIRALVASYGDGLRPAANSKTINCPACGGAKAARIAEDDRSWRCRARGCGASGDLITFEMAATGRDFPGACAALEAAFPEGGPDGASGDLFATGGGDV